MFSTDTDTHPSVSFCAVILAETRPRTATKINQHPSTAQRAAAQKGQQRYKSGNCEQDQPILSRKSGAGWKADLRVPARELLDPRGGFRCLTFSVSRPERERGLARSL
jgi:hypothetical protein